MITLAKFVMLGAMVLAPSAWSNDSHSPQQDNSVKNALRAHIEFLADDVLQGRDTGSNEYEISARYVASHFKQYGLKPAGENNSWFQSVPFVKSQLDTKAVQMMMHQGNKETTFAFPEQFMSYPSATTSELGVRAKLAFVGYGIVSERLKHDDYANIDVTGKIVVMLAGRPDAFPSEQGAHVSSSAEKARHAAANGAVGMIAIHTPAYDKVRTYQRATQVAGTPTYHWRKKQGGVFGDYPSLKGSAYVSKETGKTLFKAAGHDLTKVFGQIEAGGVPSGYDMDLEVSFSKNSRHESVQSSNVVAVLEGSDPQLKHEYVVYSAHLDHIGIHGKGEDKINNGALDNAAGIAVMLETARRFSMSERPKRSILFVAVTAEERGLLGSNYFAHYPTVPIDAMVANINLDMPLLLYPFADVVAFGAEHSTMKGFVETAANAHGLSLSPDPVPEQAVFVRSDHYSLVKQGVPAIFLVVGFQSKDPQFNGGKIFGQFLKKHYHQPSDDTSLAINYDAGVVFSKVNYSIGENIANSKTRPSWNKGDFFGDTFAAKTQ